MFGDIIQPTHLIFILVVALLVLGPKRLPEVGRQLGRGLRDFRQGLQGVESEARGLFRDALDDPTPSVPAATTATQPGFSPALNPAPSPHFVISPETHSEPHLVIAPDSESTPTAPSTSAAAAPESAAADQPAG